MRERRRRRYLPQPPAWEDEALPDHAAGNGWLIIYLDVMTLVLCLFVVLMAYSSFSMEEYRELTKTLSNKVAVQGEVELRIEPELQREKTEAAQAEPAEQAAERLQERFREELLNQGLQDSVELSFNTNQVNLQIGERILFDFASADLSVEGEALLARLVPLLQGAVGYAVSIEGHTDSVPISNEQFPSNWELSAQRATRVLRVLASQGVDISRMRAIGYGATQPLADNTTPEGRARNRRVALVLHMPDQ